MTGTDVVEAELLEQLHTLLNGTGIGGSAKGSEGVVVGDALEDDLLAIQLEAEIGAVFNGTHAETRTDAVGH